MRMVVDGRGQYFPGDNSFPTLARQMDHDLRSPLTAICSYAECLAWLPGLEAGVRESYARTILTEAQRLGRMASNFLVLAAPPLSNELDELDLGEALAEALGDLEGFIALHECEVHWRKPTDVKVIWPQAVLHQLLVAMIETGVEASTGSGAMELEWQSAGAEEWWLTISSAGGAAGRGDETFACRAAVALSRQRGGELTLQSGRPMRLALRLPVVGRVLGEFGAEPVAVTPDGCSVREANATVLEKSA
jgi:hypothetical protein